jgi:hypothetical protein
MYMTMTVSNKSKQNKNQQLRLFPDCCHVSPVLLHFSSILVAKTALSPSLSHSLLLSLSHYQSPLFPPLSLSPSIAHFSLSPSLTHSLSQSIPSLKIFSPQYDSLLSSYLTLSYCISVCSLLQWSF